MQDTIEEHVNLATSALKQYQTVGHLIFNTFLEDISLVKKNDWSTFAPMEQTNGPRPCRKRSFQSCQAC